MLNLNKKTWLIVLTGAVVGIAALVLTLLGNPANMGFCIACFERDIAGSMGLHSAAVVQYFRPEIVGIVLGAFIAALVTKEFKPKAGSSPATRFLLGAFVMIGALVFLGCPLRMVIRMGGGDINAFAGLLGFIAGILIGIVFLKKGFELKRAHEMSVAEGVSPVAVLGLLFVASLLVPALFKWSEKGPGSMHAPALIALTIAIVVGFLAQRARLCMVGGIRDLVLFKDGNLLTGFVAIFAVITIGNLILGKYKLGTASQPIAHSAEVWNFLGMTIVGWGSVLLGGCPLRQLVLSAEGNGDSTVTVFGMIVGAAVSHNFTLAGSADSVTEGVYSVGGISVYGKIAVGIILVALLVISLVNVRKEQKEA